MAGEVPPLNIVINLETTGVQAGVNQATEGVKKVAAEADKTASRFSNLKSVMIGTFAASEIQKGISEFEGFLKDSVKAAEEAQTSVAALGTAMNNAKVNTDANRQAVMQSTDQMENLGFKANDTREAFTKMITATGSVSESTKLMGVAADYARLKHMDLAQAATILSRGTSGAVRAFREYGITLDSSLPKNQAIAKAFDELNKKIGGQAAAYAETYAGKLAIVSAKSEDLKEKIGSLLLPVLTKLETWFIGSLTWLSNHKAAMEAIAVVIGSVLLVVITNVTAALYAQAAAWVAANLPMLAIVATVLAIAGAFIWAWNKFDWFRQGVVTGIEAILDVFSFLIHAIGFVAEAFIQIETGPLRLFLKALGFFVPAAKEASKELDKLPKMVGDFFDGAANKVDSFKKTVEGVKNTKIDIKFPNVAEELAKAGGSSSGAPLGIEGQVHEAGTKASKAATAAAAKLKTAQDDYVKLMDQQAAILKDRQDRMDAAQTAYDNKALDAQTKFDEAKATIDQRYQDASDAATTAFNDATEKAAQTHQDNLINIQQAAVDKQKGIIQQSIDAMTSNFANVTKFDLTKIFSQTGTTSGLISGMQYQLKQILQLQKDAGDLAAKGYTQSFINQVVAQGPMVGDQMAQTLLNATPETTNQIKSLYDQIDTVSNSGLDQLAQTMNDGTTFATSAMAKQYAQVSVDLQKSLADENTKYQDSLNTAQAAFDKAMTSANNARDLAMKAASDSLANSLTSAQQALDASIKAISDSTMKQLDALQLKIEATATKISSLGGTVPSVPAVTVPSTSAYTPTTSSPYSSAPAGPSVNTSTLAGIQAASVTNISAPITVNGSTAAPDIQAKLLSMAKFGLL